MAIGDYYNFSGNMTGFPGDPAVGHIVAWQYSEGFIDPFFEITTVTSDDEWIVKQLSAGTLPSAFDDVLADVLDDGGYGGSGGKDYLLSLSEDPTPASSFSPPVDIATVRRLVAIGNDQVWYEDV
jgi:hypothetical protein